MNHILGYNFTAGTNGQVYAAQSDVKLPLRPLKRYLSPGTGTGRWRFSLSVSFETQQQCTVGLSHTAANPQPLLIPSPRH